MVYILSFLPYCLYAFSILTHWGRDIFKLIFFNEIIWISFKISLKFGPVVWINNIPALVQLTHWGQVTHICISKLTIIGSGDGLLPGQHQAIIWTNGG